MPQNSKFGYGTVGVQTNPTQPVQTTTPFMRIDGDIMKVIENVKNTSIQNIRNNASTIVEGNETTEGTLNMELSPVDIVFFLLSALGTISSVDISSATDGSVFEHTIQEDDCDLETLSLEIKKGGCAQASDDPSGQSTMVSRAYGCTVDTLAINIEEGILTANTEVKAYGAFDVARLVTDAVGTTYGFRKGSTRGLVVGDTCRLYEYNTNTYEEVSVTAVDYSTDEVTFASVTSALFTVANKTKLELVQKNVSYDAPQLFGFKNARVRIADDLASAATADPIAVKTLNFNIANNLQVDSQTEYNTVKETGSDYNFDMNLLFENLQIRDAYRDREEQAMIIEIDNAHIISATDTNNATYSIRIEVDKFIYETREAPTATGALIEETVNGSVLYDHTTDRSVVFKIRNDKAGTYYA